MTKINQGYVGNTCGTKDKMRQKIIIKGTKIKYVGTIS